MKSQCTVAIENTRGAERDRNSGGYHSSFVCVQVVCCSLNITWDFFTLPGLLMDTKKNVIVSDMEKFQQGEDINY